MNQELGCEALHFEDVDDQTERIDRSSARVVIQDAQMKTLYDMVDRVAASTIGVLLLGETGVGKEVFAEAIHQRSARRSKPLVRLNCAALSASLLESELFGHEKGAFTGAVKAKAGLLESANGGTVFLDEVGEMPMSTQVALLRVIERREVLRVGDVKPRPIDVRFVAATNRDLEDEAAKGRFRPDLYFRLNGISLFIPPLRERVSEIEPLARAFISHACRQTPGAVEPTLSAEALATLMGCSWRGNIRELKNTIERAVLLCGAGSIQVEHLLVERMRAPVLNPRCSPPSPSRMVALPTKADGVMAEYPPIRSNAGEREQIVEALGRCAGNQTLTARLLHISRRTLLSRLDRHGIPRPRKVEPPQM